MRTFFAAVGLALISPSCLGVADVGASAEFGWMQVGVRGDAGLAATGTTGTPSTVDVEDELGLGDVGAPYARVELDLSLAHVTLSAFRYSENSRGALSSGFGMIPATAPVRADTELNNVKAAVGFDVLELPVFRLSPGIAIDYFDVDMRVESPPFGAEETLRIDAPIPELFLQAEVDLGVVSATVDVSGMSADIGDVSGEFADVEALLRVHPAAHLQLFGGYRWLSIEADGTSDGQRFDADLRISGWFVGGGVTF